MSWRNLSSRLCGMFMLAAADLLHIGKSVGFRTFHIPPKTHKYIQFSLDSYNKRDECYKKG